MIVQPPVEYPSIGLFSLNEGASVPPGPLAEVATLAEELGYESLWMGEHPFLPDPPGPHSPFSAQLQLVDPVIALTYLAGITSRIRLATGILILPLRNPIVLAKALASLDHLSGGRLTVGIGMGYIEHQARMFGIDFATRGARGREHLAAMRTLWHDAKPEFHGKYVDFHNVDAHPRPVQQSVPVVAGGHTVPALKLAATQCQGWYGFGCTPQAAAELVRQIEELGARHGRPEHLGPLEITVTPPRGPVSDSALRAYAAAGVHRVVTFPQLGLDLAGLIDYVRTHAPARILAH
ncbi:TIGR03619 family F420-dependent LLM class oxidoreductase [Saccharothrix deserti]|uniref:TIGR03619 family F420-dependent LLM class oxidoreductase n=1 Tax=Saccharothrix deserti TaxID=2593674 RepID=UPI00131CB57B|nr:TIGR03619 family F420-dependent LLM class oxidoreductase [Saccharothrix deserti]